MTAKSRKTLSILLRTVICIGAMYWVLSTGFQLRDYATFPDGRRVQILNWTEVANEEALNDPAAIYDVRVEVEPGGSITLGELARNEDGSPQFSIGLKSVLAGSDHRLLLLAMLLFLPVPVIQSMRFTWMVRAQDIELSHWEGIKLSYAGNFLNFVAIGSTGGDLFKAYYVAQHTPRKTEAVTTVLLDRVVGLMSLILIAAVAICIEFDDPRIRQWWPLIAALTGGLVLGIFVAFSQRFRGALQRTGLWKRVEPLLQRLPLIEHLKRVDAATHRMRHHKGLLLWALALTIALQGLAILSFTVAGIGLGMKPVIDAGYFVYTAIALLVAAVPISYQGMGTMDAVLQFLFRGAYGNYSQVLFFGFAIRIIQLLWSLPGFLVPITGAHRPSKEKLASLQSLPRPSES